MQSCCLNLSSFIHSRLKKLPRVSPAQVGQHLIQLLEETTREDDIHDVEFLVRHFHISY